MAVEKRKQPAISLAHVKDAGDDFAADTDGTSIEAESVDVQSLHQTKDVDVDAKAEMQSFKDQLVKDAVGAIGRAAANANMDHVD